MTGYLSRSVTAHGISNTNEYGGDNRKTECHCPSCQNAFRAWLKARYKTLDALNYAWWTEFWSNTIADWEEIHSPIFYGEYSLHGLKLDWRRFMSDQYIDFCRNEIKSVRKYSDRPVTTNLMGAFKPINYFKLARELDLVSLDSYPFWHFEENEQNQAMRASFSNSLMRSLKRQPYLLMESVPSVVNWMPRCSLKRPGMHELSSLQTIANGANSVQYFQWRKGRGGSEKYHGAVIDHKNGGNTRVFRDVASLGKRLEEITDVVVSTCNQPKVALVFDWENWWAADDAQATLFPFDYFSHFIPYYDAFWRLGIDVDIVDMDSSLDGYSLVVAPINYMYRGSYIDRVREYVKNGGTYVTTYWSGEVDDSDLCFTGRHPLTDVLGICIDEIDVRPLKQKNQIHLEEQDFEIEDLCTLVHAELAEVLGTYTDDFYAGMPAVTVNQYGHGKAYFLAAEGKVDYIKEIYRRLAEDLDLKSGFQAELPEGVLVNERIGEDGSLFFVQNFNDHPSKVMIHKEYLDIEKKTVISGEHILKPYEVKLLWKHL
ncbi:MAG: beta-galactosidase [Eubacteriales bacterium]|nr:beta-galactosidase [Eubacteriales bacterium]